MRPGQAADIQARRRRAAEAASEATRQQLATYWQKHQPHRAPGLLPKWTDQEYYSKAEQDAQILAESKEKQKSLEERRNRLAMMLFHENLQHQAELKEAALTNKLIRKQGCFDAVPLSILREVNLGIKTREEERRRKEAELRLYHQWRMNQPAIRQFENQQRRSNLKSAWIQQIIEKEQEKKKEEEESEKVAKEQENIIKSQMDKEKENLLVKEEKMKELRAYLQKQIEELHASEKIASDLRRQEDCEINLLNALQDITAQREMMANRRNVARMTYLNNMSLHARRLRERAREAEREVEADQKQLAEIITAIEKDSEKSAAYRQEWRKALITAQESMERQRELEKLRQKRLENAMDGEARAIFQKQENTWQQEKTARQALLDEVVSTLKSQVETKIKEGKQRLRENIEVREKILEEIEKSNGEINKRQEEKDQLTEQMKKMVFLQTQMKCLEKEEQEKTEELEREKELREAIREEERLRKEILRLQREGCGSPNYRRRRVLW